MNYVITGGAGHISAPLTLQLLAAGHKVTVIGRSEKNLEALISKGAKTAIGSVEDKYFLTKTFTGADAVYAMVPPIEIEHNWKGWIEEIGKNYAAAIASAGINKVVLLSSFGAHLSDGTGPITGLHRVENLLSKLDGVNVISLRAASFYPNFFANIGLIKSMGIMGGNYGGGNAKIPLVSPLDIASVAAEELTGLKFTGKSHRYIASDERTGAEIAAVIGAAIGKPDLQWAEFTDEQYLDGAMKAGLKEEVAKNYTEMGNAIRSGKLAEDYFKNRPVLGSHKLEGFAKEFAEVYNNGAPAAH